MTVRFESFAGSPVASILHGLSDINAFVLLKAIFFVLVAVFFRQLFVAQSAIKPANRETDRAWPARVLFWTLLLLFVAVFAYQGTWHVAGFMRPAFLDFMRKYSHRPFNPAKQVSRGRILDAKGVILARNDAGNVLRRRYPLGPAAAHVVGYLSPLYGLSGLEAADNQFLCGYTVATKAELGRFGLNLLNPQSVKGNDLVTTLDSDLQWKAWDLLNGRPGAVVVLRPTDGAILALASSPSFSPEDIGAGIRGADRGGSSMFNRALHGLYPPGSTFKLLVTAAALEAGFHGVIDCPAEGYTPVAGSKPIRDHEYYAAQRENRTWSGHGPINLEYGFRKSSNVFFAKLGVSIGGSRLCEMAERMGFKSRLILFPGSSEVLASKSCSVPELSASSLRETAQVAIGQGELLVTPLHMALAAACVAADGRLYRPRLGALQPPEKMGDAMTASVAREIKRLMRETVRRGTAVDADVPGLEVAGKTGTAQNPAGDDHSWFVCFAPMARPRLAMAVLIENGGFGARAAVPLAAELLREAQRIGLFDAPRPVSAEGGEP